MVNPGRRKRKLRNPKKLTLKQKLFFGTPAQRAAAKRSLKSGGKAKKRRKVANPGRKRVTRKRRAVKATTKRRTVKRTGGYRRKRVRNAGVMKANGLYHDSRGLVKTFSTKSEARKAWSKLGGRQAGYYIHPTVKKRRKRIANVGQIITFGLAGNPGKKKRRTRKKRGVTSMASRRRRNPARRRRATVRRRRNAGFMKMFGGGRRRRRRANPGRRRTRRTANRGRRRNPGMLSGIGSQVGGIIGGAALTKFIVDKLVPVQYATGITGYAVNGLIAYLQGYLVSRFVGKPGLGAAMQIGGYTQLALRILNDFAPGLSSYSALGLRGALAQSSFYTPQIAKPNSYTQFVTPNATLRALPPPSMKGVRGGRVN